METKRDEDLKATQEGRSRWKGLRSDTILQESTEENEEQKQEEKKKKLETKIQDYLKAT